MCLKLQIEGVDETKVFICCCESNAACVRQWFTVMLFQQTINATVQALLSSLLLTSTSALVPNWSVQKLIITNEPVGEWKVELGIVLILRRYS